MNKLVKYKNQLNLISAISTIVAFLGSFAALTFWAFFPPYAIATFLGFSVLTTLYILNSKKAFREYREAIVFGIVLLNSAYLFFFGNVFFDAIANLGSCETGLDIFKNIIIIITQGIFLLAVLTVLVFEIVYEITRNIQLNKEDSIDFNDSISRNYIIANKALSYSAIGFLAFAFFSSLVLYWGNNGLLYCLFTIFSGLVAMLLFNASSHANKNTIAYVIIIVVLSFVYFGLFGVLGFADGILPIKGCEHLAFMVSWIATGMLILAVSVFGIIILVKKAKANREGYNKIS